MNWRLAGLAAAAGLGVGLGAVLIGRRRRPRRQLRQLGDIGKSAEACALQPARKVKKLLGLDRPTLPEHIQKFGNYMVWMSGKKLEPIDVVKAYVITESSIQRGEQSCEKVAPYWPELPCAPGEKVRPEHVMAKILLSPDGRRYVTAAAQGKYDARAASWVAGKFSSFGLSDQIAQALREAPRLAKNVDEVERTLRKGSRRQWMEYVAKNVKGVSYAKAGFLAAILGRGDLATADARQIGLWRASDADKSSVTPEFVEALNRRLTALNVEMSPHLRPFYQHLVHHFLWDKMGGAEVFHDEIKECMSEGAQEARATFFGRR